MLSLNGCLVHGGSLLLCNQLHHMVKRQSENELHKAKGFHQVKIDLGYFSI
jgi:hypothetical protein